MVSLPKSNLDVSKKLLEIYPNEKEGIIDKKFANLVNKKICSKIANNLNLKKFMTLGSSYKGALRSDEKITSDCLEAIIGAVFIDRGLDISEKLILRLWKEFLEKSNITEIDPKTKLQRFHRVEFNHGTGRCSSWCRTVGRLQSPSRSCQPVAQQRNHEFNEQRNDDNGYDGDVCPSARVCKWPRSLLARMQHGSCQSNFQHGHQARRRRTENE